MTPLNQLVYVIQDPQLVTERESEIAD